MYTLSLILKHFITNLKIIIIRVDLRILRSYWLETSKSANMNQVPSANKKNK